MMKLYADGCFIFQEGDMNIRGTTCVHASQTGEEAQRLAAMFAAAPDLFHALGSIENDDGRIPEAIWELRNAAIAKARKFDVPPPKLEPKAEVDHRSETGEVPAVGGD